MALRPLYGHDAVRRRLARAAAAGTLPSSILLQGSPGIGKQRLGLWLGQLLLCERALPQGELEPCGECVHCRYVLRGQHPDLHWYFPRPRLKDSDASADEVHADMAEAIAERVESEGLWTRPSGSEGLFVATTRALVQQASKRPAMAQRTVFLVGDAERMVVQEGADQAANAFLKLLEEPPPTTTLILTSSEPWALLPTIRSRVVVVRVPPVSPEAMGEFLADSVISRHFAGQPTQELLAAANGSPGQLLEAESGAGVMDAAYRMLEAALASSGPDGQVLRVKAATRQGVAGARGSFSDTLDALTAALHEHSKRLLMAGKGPDARRAAMGIVLVENAKIRAQGNVNPQLLTFDLLDSLHRTLVP